MAAPAVTLNALGILLKEEATYGAGGSLSFSTDGVQLAYDSISGTPFSYTEDWDGVRSINPGGPAALKMLAPSARVFAGAFPFQFKGYGAAYSAGNKSPFHGLIKAAGYDAAGSFTGGSEKWTFTPTPGPTGFISLLGNLITHGTSFPFTAAFVKGWKCTMQGARPPIHTFDIIGLLGDPATPGGGAKATDVVYPLLSVEPPKFESATVTIGSFVLPDVVSVEWDAGRSEPSARLLGTAAGTHAGWAQGVQLAPTLTITIEQTALVGSPFHTSAGLDPYALRKAVTSLGVGVKYGAQYDRIGWNFTQAQLAAPVGLGANGSVGTWVLKFAPYTTTPIANDSHNVLLD